MASPFRLTGLVNVQGALPTTINVRGGVPAIATVDRDVAIGSGSQANNTGFSSEGAVAIGDLATATAGSTVAIGSGAQATVSGATAVGHAAQATAQNAIAIGYGADPDGQDSIAIGADSNAAGLGSIVIGSGLASAGNSSIAIGYGASSGHLRAVAVGHNSPTVIREALHIGAMPDTGEPLSASGLKHGAATITGTGNANVFSVNLEDDNDVVFLAFQGHVAAYNDADASFAMWEIRGLVSNAAGTVTLRHQNVVEVLDTAATFSLTISVSSPSLVINVASTAGAGNITVLGTLLFTGIGEVAV